MELGLGEGTVWKMRKLCIFTTFVWMLSVFAFLIYSVIILILYFLKSCIVYSVFV